MLKNEGKNIKNPLDEVMKILLKSQAKTCVRAQIKLDDLGRNSLNKKLDND